MSWEVVSTYSPPTLEAIYFLSLPDENAVLYHSELSNYTTPMYYAGDLSGFQSHYPQGTPLIPLDTHSALVLGWVDVDRMMRNRPYLDEKIKAAIALVA
jgi:hypothetical protein